MQVKVTQLKYMLKAYVWTISMHGLTFAAINVAEKHIF